MTETVVSKFEKIWIDILISSFCGLGIITGLAIVYLKHGSDYSNVVLMLLLACGISLIFIIFNRINVTLLRITVAPTGLALKYLLTNKIIVIDYADITHVENVHEMSRRDPKISIGIVKLNVELNTGEKLVIEKGNYSNYDELKEAIRRNRFHLDETPDQP